MMKTRYISASACIMAALSLHAQKIELVGILPNADGGFDGRMVIAKVDAEGKAVKDIDVESFSLGTGESVVTANSSIKKSDGYYLIPIPALDRSFDVPYVTTTDRYAYRVRLTTADGARLVSEMIEDNGTERFLWLGSDVKWTAATAGHNSASVDSTTSRDKSYIPLNGVNYKKSFNTHAEGSLTFSFPEDNPYSRFFTYYGVEDGMAKGDVRFIFTVNGEILEDRIMYSSGNKSIPSTYDRVFIRKFETPVDGKTDIYIKGDIVDDNSGDQTNFPMGRIYLKPDTRKAQTQSWPKEKMLSYNKPFTYTLDNPFPSAGTVYYELNSGSQYATLEGNTLNVHTLPDDKSAYIEVTAYQFGTDDYLPAPPATCRFYVSSDKTVPRDGRLELNSGDVVDELTVYADPDSRGQVVVKGGGYAEIKKLRLKYTFTPGKWNFVTFPADVNIDRISNLSQLGYRLNDNRKAFYICEYSTRLRAEKPEADAWAQLPTADVVRNKGYIMGISRSADNPDNTPVEVTFVFENTTLGIDDSGNGSLNVELNMTDVEPGTAVPVYVRPDGIKGAPLKVMVTFSPEDLSVLPVNYTAALDEARITFLPDDSGIRLTLPTQDPAKVVIFDRKDRIVKAVNYIAPYAIDIRTLAPGEYRAYIQYGNATAVKTFTVEKKK